MRFHEIISEKTLPLLKGELNRARGSYGAFVITMNPEDFLKLTASPHDLAIIKQQTFPKPWDEFSGSYSTADQDFGRFPAPFLKVACPSGKVLGHEGRHRALMVLNQGGTNFPVIIYLRQDSIYTISYEEFHVESGEEFDRTETFNDAGEARQRYEQLKFSPVSEPINYFGVKMETQGGGAIKGSPSFIDPEDPWKKKSFQKSDMPAQLISEYSDDVVVTNYRVGLVKGYNHFRA